MAVFLISSFFILNSSFALAASPSQEALDQLNAAAGSSGANIAGSGPLDPRVLVAKIIKTLLTFIGIFFVVLNMYAGFLWMTAGGEEEKASKAKKLIFDGVVGLAIILSAYAISYFIFRSLLCATASGSPFGCGNAYGPDPNNYNIYNGQAPVPSP